VFLQLPRCSYSFPGVPTAAQVFLHLPRCSYICPGVPTSAQVFLNLPSHTWICLDIGEAAPLSLELFLCSNELRSHTEGSAYIDIWSSTALPQAGRALTGVAQLLLQLPSYSGYCPAILAAAQHFWKSTDIPGVAQLHLEKRSYCCSCPALPGAAQATSGVVYTYIWSSPAIAEAAMRCPDLSSVSCAGVLRLLRPQRVHHWLRL
jgi:hypothetical protein